MPAHRTPEGFIPRLGAWLSRSHPRRFRKSTVVILPKSARIFGGALYLRLPQDFVPVRGRQPVLTGKRSGMRLTVARVPFSQPLRHITALDLQIAFRRIITPHTLPEVTYGFQRHSPTLTAVWNVRRGDRKSPQNQEKTVLRLIQVRKTAFVLLLEHVTTAHEATAEAIMLAASADPDIGMR